jgi:ubiquitin-protein ligase
VTSNPPAGMTIRFVDESNVHNWEITMDGPEGSPYVVRSHSPALGDSRPFHS